MKTSISCAFCKQSTLWKDNPYRPFCSSRCQQLDLGNWADGSYAIPIQTTDPLEYATPTTSTNPHDEE